jgi:NarL family two-component system response regulator LiaR
MEKKKQVLIATPNDTLRQGLHTIFAREMGSEHVHEAATEQRLKFMLKSYSFDILLIHEAFIPDMTHLPQGNVVILATKPDMSILHAARYNGASGYLLETASESLLHQLLHLPQGTFLTDADISSSATEYLKHHLLLTIDLEILTPREREIFDLAWKGVSEQEIARMLNITYATVRTHMSHIYHRLSLHRFQAKVLAITLGLDIDYA